MMQETEGWLARAARRLGEIMTGGWDDVGPLDIYEPRPEAPISVDEPVARQNVPPGIRVDDNGRYVAGGYSFSTVEQAAHYAARLSRPASSTPVPRQFEPEPRAPASTPSPTRTPAETGNTPRWIGEPTALLIGGNAVMSEMVYFGTPSRREPQHDHSRIDPKLAVDTRGDPHGVTLNYWPSYAGMEPRARWTYLDWLSRGRNDPSTPIGYVFVFFYGLEQRLLVDNAREDAEGIFAEVRRLLTIYGENYSFQSYAQRLLALSCLYEMHRDEPATIECSRTYDFELPLDLRVRLGRRLRDNEPFTGDDCLRWVLALPDVYLRTPGQRCFEELRALWLARFAAKHPDGLSVRRPKKEVRHDYRAASGTFNCKVSVEELPDISGTVAPLTPLRGLLDSCLDDLSAYSRLIGRDPEARGRLRGDLLLPPELHGGRSSLEQCRSELEKLVELSGISGVPANRLAQLLDVEIVSGTEKLPATVVRQVTAALDVLNYGCEPDRRYGPAVALRPDARIALFSSPNGGPVDHERDAYVSARAMVEVAMLAAVSDGELVPAEIGTMARRLHAIPDLSEAEIARLQAYGMALAADPPKVRAALKKLAEVPPSSRAALAASAVEAVLADGRVHPDEVRFLEALHAALNIPVASLYSAIHRGGEDSGPVLVVAGQAENIVPIPVEQENANVVPIDAARLERIRHETSQVSALLSSIFVEDVEQPVAPSVEKQQANGAYDGLDAAHAELLVRLLAAPMSRDDFEAAASSLRLMPDGAIETLNEWGFDRIGDAIVEDDDEVRIVPDMLQQIGPMGVAA